MQENPATSAVPEGFRYVPGFLSPAEQDRLLQRIETLEYEHDRFRGQTLKRGYAQFGYAYVTTGRKLIPAPAIPDFLEEVIVRGLPYCRPGTEFNQCIVTEYPKTAGIDWHTDAPA